ncbi:metal ABC transporter ATP-binding protein [Brachybacterium sp. EF45031]|uniref:metal ABC transporter ATP-binding protein n=1 Tax=Brachybacterium sillae TaxID=2810536 RepID=UPI00217E5F62|nr:metal ABC transporter ATP-binding protein [Brachybacterium sillae]MCS6710754.1 metal ABC transporter ATP-binding protein [Brachybacterium sillae]
MTPSPAPDPAVSAVVPSPSPLPPRAEVVLEVRDAHLAYGPRTVLDGVSVAVRRGEMVGLLGANGSGKSTLLRALVGAQALDSGQAEIIGTPVRDGRAHRVLGYVPQHTADAGNIPATAAETVATGLLGPSAWFARSRDPRVRAALDLVGLSALARRPISEMSGGQRQRVMLARALVKRPDLLVLDEPFTGVDIPGQELLAGILRELVAGGTTVLVVLHDLGPLADDLSRVVVLDAGRVVHDGAPADRPLLDPGHEHPVDAAQCLGQELLHP